MMDEGEDFIMAGGNSSECLTCEDYTRVEPCRGFCLLCEYGSTPGHETDDNINNEVKTLEKVIKEVRMTTGIQKASEIIHEYYVDNLQHLEPFCNHDEWTVEMIEDHLCRHGAPEAVARGERPGEDMVSINVVFSLYYLFKY